MAKPTQTLAAENLVKLVEALETIKVTPERVKKNKTHMSDNNGGLIKY
jgi:hypothetical protein